MADHKSFIMYKDVLEYAEDLSNEQLGELYRAQLMYANGKDVEITDPEVKGVWRGIKHRMDKDAEAYQIKCEKNAANRKGTSTTVNERERPSTTVNERERSGSDIDNDIDTEDTNVSKEKGCTNVHPKKKSAPFVAPCVSEVRAYCDERHNSVDPEAFVDFYQSKNWMVGKNRMVDWKAAVRNWERDSRARPVPPADRNSAVIAGFLARHAEEDSS